MPEKKLVMIRHAKSSWNKPDLADFDRGLNKRGKRDAPFMANILNEHGIEPDRVILSSSNRTLQTWKLMNETFELSSSKVEKYDELYHSTPGKILSIINEQGDDIETLFCIVHNPGITGFVNLVCSENIFNIPTTGIAVISIPSFSSLELAQGSLDHYFFPKQFAREE